MSPYTLYSPVGQKYCLHSLLIDRYGEQFSKRHRWKYHFLFTEIIKANFGVDARWVELHSATLGKRLGKITVFGKQEKAYLLIRRDLQDWSIIRYHTHQEATTLRKAAYRVNDEVMSRGFIRSDLSAPAKASKPRRVVHYTGLYRQLQQSFKRATINQKEAIALALHAFQTKAPLPAKRSADNRVKHERHVNAPVLARWLARIDCFCTGETYFKISNKRKTGRLNSSFTSFPKLLRSAIAMDGKPLVEVDVSACQPLLLTIVTVQYFTEQGQVPGEDLLRWQDLCEHGEIYPFLYANLMAQGILLPSMTDADTGSLSAKCTSAFKIDLFAKVVFSKESRTKVRGAFDELFPSVSTAIRAAKNPNHNALAIRLQRMESELMIRTVCARLYQQKHRDFLTLHDAIYCTPDLVGSVVAEIRKAFLKIGLSPAIKVDGHRISPAA